MRQAYNIASQNIEKAAAQGKRRYDMKAKSAPLNQETVSSSRMLSHQVDQESCSPTGKKQSTR